MLRGRGGTGKTFALVQVALHLARQGKRTAILTYNHGLIADINRALRFIDEKEPSLHPLPELQTRYAFIQEVFVQSFGRMAESVIKKHIGEIRQREIVRLHALSHPDAFLDEVIPGKCTSHGRSWCSACLDQDDQKTWRWRDICNQTTDSISPWDYVLIDEGQDWTEEQRDFVYNLFGPNHVVVADGIDQFVGQDRCNWDRGDIPINRRHSLRSSRRTKGATCQTVAEIAFELGLSDWDLEPDPNAHGGRFTVVVEPDARRAVAHGLEILENDQREYVDLRAVDNLICLPSAKMARGVNYSALFDEAIDARSRDSWRGFEEEDRRIYPLRDGQIRAVQYNSCRGMEGWTTLCLGLDAFFEFQTEHPRIDVSGLEASIREKDGFLFSKELMEAELAREKRIFAINWLMIPLTRSIDHLVVHLADEQSELGQILSKVSERCPGAIEWIDLSGKAISCPPKYLAASGT